MATTEDDIRALGAAWITAERDADAAALDELSVADFTLVGPLGFVLDKQRWLDRYRSGAFATEELNWTDVAVRRYGDTAVLVGRQTQRAQYQGHRADGEYRTTCIAVRDDGRWLLAGAHLSPIHQPTPRETS